MTASAASGLTLLNAQKSSAYSILPKTFRWIGKRDPALYWDDPKIGKEASILTKEKQ
jgi:hypothetical protein